MSRLQSKNNVFSFFENPSGNSVFHFHPYQQIHWRKYHWSSGLASFNGLKPFKRIVSKDECKLPIVQLTACTCVLYMTRGVHKMFINHLSFFRQKYIFIQSTLCSIIRETRRNGWGEMNGTLEKIRNVTCKFSQPIEVRDCEIYNNW